ncbi:MAG: helix-turn-helix transcriptional regulator [Treponema sp.]|nr:helix-turn-helix transcriptional regulator [Treponema sp.]
MAFKSLKVLSISFAQLSIICNCGTGTIGGIESGKAKPSFEMMIKIAEALIINPADLFKTRNMTNIML